jgi:hypothetical protein
MTTLRPHRAQRRFTFFSTLRQDLRYAVRTLVRAPGFTIVAILTLAIGILGNTTIFSGVNALLYTPLPTKQPEQIAQVLSGRGDGSGRGIVKHTYKRYTSFRDTNTSFAALAAIRDVTAPISDRAPAAGTATEVGVVRGEIASGNYFDMFGVRAANGRTFTPDDDRTPNGHPVVVISDRLWRTQFSADPQTLGRVVYLNGYPFTVIGIAPASFTGTVFANETDFWAPLMMQGQFGAAPNWWSETRQRNIVVFSIRKFGSPAVKGSGQEVGDLRVLGRLKPDVGAGQAAAELTTIAAGLAQANKLTPPRIDVLAELEARHQGGLGGLEQVRGISRLALWASGLVWLIACGNVANLFLARATARRREIAIRLSLGAGCWRVVRQLLTESTALGRLQDIGNEPGWRAGDVGDGKIAGRLSFGKDLAAVRHGARRRMDARRCRARAGRVLSGDDAPRSRPVRAVHPGRRQDWQRVRGDRHVACRGDARPGVHGWRRIGVRLPVVDARRRRLRRPRHLRADLAHRSKAAPDRHDQQCGGTTDRPRTGTGATGLHRLGQGRDRSRAEVTRRFAMCDTVPQGGASCRDC